MDLEVIAELYLGYQHKKDPSDQWAWDAVKNLINQNADEAWETTSILVNKTTSDEALAYVAAGPLEDLLKRYGLEVMERIEQESSQNPRLQPALSGVWGIELGNPHFERWYALMWRYSFAEGKRSLL